LPRGNPWLWPKINNVMLAATACFRRLRLQISANLTQRSRRRPFTKIQSDEDQRGIVRSCSLQMVWRALPVNHETSLLKQNLKIKIN
jgi:hypothetical protein